MSKQDIKTIFSRMATGAFSCFIGFGLIVLFGIGLHAIWLGSLVLGIVSILASLASFWRIGEILDG